MPTNGDRIPELAVDSSAALAFLLDGTALHEEARRTLTGSTMGLVGHAWFETYSVLTRLEPPARLDPAIAATVLLDEFPHPVFLSPSTSSELRAGFPRVGIAGGAVYDALVGAAAEHGLELVTAGRRARRTYEALDVRVRYLGLAPSPHHE